MTIDETTLRKVIREELKLIMGKETLFTIGDIAKRIGKSIGTARNYLISVKAFKHNSKYTLDDLNKVIAYMKADKPSMQYFTRNSRKRRKAKAKQNEISTTT